MKIFDWNNRPFISFGFVLFFLIFFMTIFNLIGTLIFTPINTTAEVVRQTLDPTKIIYDYEWFKRQYAEVQAFSKKTKNAKEALFTFEESLKDLSKKDWSFEHNQRYNELTSQILGLKNQCEDMVREYNAKSKMINRNFVKFGDLPEELTSDECVAKFENNF